MCIRDRVDIAAGFSNLIAALMGGQIDVFFMTYGSAQDYIASGDIVPLGGFSEERTDAAPDVPTFREQGLDLVFEKFFFLSLIHIYGPQAGRGASSSATRRAASPSSAICPPRCRRNC